MVPLSAIERTGNGHRDVGDLRRLAASIESHGIKVPVRVYPLNGGYGLIDGDDRLAAAEMLGLPEVPAEIVEQPEEREEAIAHLLSKPRDGLDAIERAREYEKLLDLGCTQAGIAKALGRHPASISQEAALLRLIPELQEAVTRGRLAVRAGYHLAGLPRMQQAELVETALAAGSTRRVEGLVRSMKEKRRVQQPTVAGARRIRKELRGLHAQLPLPETIREQLEPVLMQIEGEMKEIWRLM